MSRIPGIQRYSHIKFSFHRVISRMLLILTDLLFSHSPPLKTTIWHIKRKRAHTLQIQKFPQAKKRLKKVSQFFFFLPRSNQIIPGTISCCRNYVTLLDYCPRSSLPLMVQALFFRCKAWCRLSRVDLISISGKPPFKQKCHVSFCRLVLCALFFEGGRRQ